MTIVALAVLALLRGAAAQSLDYTPLGLPLLDPRHEIYARCFSAREDPDCEILLADHDAVIANMAPFVVDICIVNLYLQNCAVETRFITGYFMDRDQVRATAAAALARALARYCRNGPPRRGACAEIENWFR